jgi:hypothetical protein
MKAVEPSLKERAGLMYRRLLLLQHLFHARDEDPDAPARDECVADAALGAAVREVLDELTEHARLLTSIPSPIGEWRPGDTRDDDRWRALTEVERREVVALASGYDSLITWAEQMACGQMELAALLEMSGEAVGGQRLPRAAHVPNDAVDFLKAERTRVARFRQEMRFLTRRTVE